MRDVRCFLCRKCSAKVGPEYRKKCDFRLVPTAHDWSGLRPVYEGFYAYQGLAPVRCAVCQTSEPGYFWHAQFRSPHP